MVSLWGDGKKGSHLYRETKLDTISMLINYDIQVGRKAKFVEFNFFIHFPILVSAWFTLSKEHVFENIMAKLHN